MSNVNFDVELLDLKKNVSVLMQTVRKGARSIGIFVVESKLSRITSTFGFNYPTEYKLKNMDSTHLIFLFS